jgi:hypothetical protein
MKCTCLLVVDIVVYVLITHQVSCCAGYVGADELIEITPTQIRSGVSNLAPMRKPDSIALLPLELQDKPPQWIPPVFKPAGCERGCSTPVRAKPMQEEVNDVGKRASLASLFVHACAA